MKKFLAIFLALVMVLGLCACGQGSSNGGHGLTADGKVKLSIGMPSNANILSLDNNAFTRWIEEKCGVEITFVEYAGGTDVATQISTTIAARQELPDILWGVQMNTNTISRYGKEGYFVDLSPYYNDKEGKAKVFWERMENELTEAEQDVVIRTITDPTTGEIYGAPCVETSLIDKQQFQLWINTKWLDTLGLEKPTNNDDLVKVLKAFKNDDPNGNGQPDEIPLYGSLSGLGGNIVDWLLNLFVYYREDRPYLVDENGKLSPVFMDDDYREGLKFINKLVKEGLLSPLTFTTTTQEMKGIVTPTAGTPLVGIFAGHLSQVCQNGNEIMYDYEPLQTWGYAIRNDLTVSPYTYITESCQNVDKAFEVLMAVWSWEGSMRARYGEYGNNWTDATEGAVSAMGIDATFKLVNDPFGKQNDVLWAKMGPALNIMAEMESAELAAELPEWDKKKAQMHAENYALIREVEETRTPEKVMPKLVYSEEDTKAVEKESTNTYERYRKAQNDFILSQNGMDPNNDANWDAYIQEMIDFGIEKLTERAQRYYDKG